METAKAQIIEIVLERCDPDERSTCKNDTEFKDWLQGVYMMTVENEWIYYKDEIGIERRLVPRSSFKMDRINDVIKEEKNKFLLGHQIEFQDKWLMSSLNLMPTEMANYFKITNQKT